MARRTTRTRAGAALLLAISAGSAPAASAAEVDDWRGVGDGTRRPAVDASEVVIVLRAQPAATRKGPSREATAAAEAAQTRALEKLAARGIHLDVHRRVSKAVNAVVARVPADERARLAAAPQVAAVFPLRLVVPAAVGEGAVAALPGDARPLTPTTPGGGGGIVVAVLDGPVDATHPYLAGRVDLPAGIDRPTSYGPEADHGTAVAGIVGGANGPAGLHGVAPGVRILSVPVLAARDGALVGTTADLLDGFERAADPNGDGDLSDRARVVVAAVSSPWSGFADAPEVRAIANLARLGSVVVAAAGNDGRSDGVRGPVGLPAAAPESLAVGALDGRRQLPVVDIALGGAVTGEIRGAPLAGALAPPPGLAQALVPRPGGTARPGDPQAYLDAAGRSLVAGRIVILDQSPHLRSEVEAAATAGAVAVAIAGSGPRAGSLGVDERAPIPVVSLGDDLGRQVRAALANGQEATLTFGAAAYRDHSSAETLAAFSSSGPTHDGRLRPDIVLPGVAIATAAGGGGYETLTGTSAAAAQAAGLVATLAAVHPDWTASHLRASLIASARPVGLAGGGLAPVETQGAGRPDDGAASASSIVAEPTALALGALDATGAARGAITLTNTGASSIDVRLGFQRDGGQDAARVALTADRPQMQIAPGARERVTLTLRVRDVTAGSVIGGWLVLTTGAGEVRVPIAAIAAGPQLSVIRSATLSADALARRAKLADQVVLALALGGYERAADGRLQVLPIRRLAIDIWRGPRRYGRLYRARDLLPGSYRFRVRPLGAGGRGLPKGRYELRIVATAVDGSVERVTRVVRVR